MAKKAEKAEPKRPHGHKPIPFDEVVRKLLASKPAPKASKTAKRKRAKS